MSALFHLDILSEEKTVFSGEISSLIVPAEYGYLGVLAEHTPIIAHLVKGQIIWRDKEGNPGKISCDNTGFLEVQRNKASLILC